MVCAQVPEVYIYCYMYAPSPPSRLLGLYWASLIAGERIVLHACHHLLVVIHTVSLFVTLSPVSVSVLTPSHPARKHEAFGRPSSGLYPRLNSLRESSTHAARHPSMPSSSSNKSARTATPSSAAVVVVDSDSENDRLEAAARATAKKEKAKGKATISSSTRYSQGASGASGEAAVLRRGTAPVDLDTPSPILLNVRDVRGHIISSLVKPPPIVHDRVPSLGNALDEYVDRHGLPNEFILNVYTAYSLTTTRDQFVRTMATVISVQEAKWLWPQIKLSVNHATRVRNFARP
ncbi:hypothetical protein BC835DRAFT_1422551 [Cytidiella melzeri]|nr:hypothetical protein BC835DRAFT_1422551 [Cytidiella melzeri]